MSVSGMVPVSRIDGSRTERASEASASVVKRVVDVVGAALGLLATAPLLLAVAVAVRVGMGSPVLFRQTRPGYLGHPFCMVKFRTMREPRDNERRELSDGARLTALGKFLRRTSLDELPELWNVLRGEMSLVGPRPLLMQYLPYFTEREQHRFSVRPGITGWAQVCGRNAVPWDERLALDVWYVEHWTLMLDLRILARTIGVVVGARGVDADPHARVLNLDEERASSGMDRD